MTLFNNCYTYNPPHFQVVSMAKGLEQLILRKMDNMPKEVSSYVYSDYCLQDWDCIFANCYKFNQNEDDVALMCKNLENLYREKIKLLPAEVSTDPCTS